MPFFQKGIIFIQCQVYQDVRVCALEYCQIREHFLLRYSPSFHSFY